MRWNLKIFSFQSSEVASFLVVYSPISSYNKIVISNNSKKEDRIEWEERNKKISTWESFFSYFVLLFASFVFVICFFFAFVLYILFNWKIGGEQNVKKRRSDSVVVDRRSLPLYITSPDLQSFFLLLLNITNSNIQVKKLLSI